MNFAGQCHCGAIGFSYGTGIRPGDWSVRACQCGFCRAHDARSTSDPGGRLEFTTREPECLQRYRFGLATADFLLCRRCGVYVGAAIRTDGGAFGIINTHALHPRPRGLADPVPIRYDEEDAGERVARRGARWTPVTSSP